MSLDFVPQLWYSKKGVTREALQWTLAMVLVVVAQCAFADTISTFKITGAAGSVFQFDGEK